MDFNFILKEQYINKNNVEKANCLISFIPKDFSDYGNGFNVSVQFLNVGDEIDLNSPSFVKDYIINDSTCTHTENKLPCKIGWTDLKHFQTGINGHKIPDPSILDDIKENILVNSKSINNTQSSILNDGSDIFEISFDITKEKNHIDTHTFQNEVKHNQPLQLKKNDGTYKNLNEHINLETNINDIGSLLAVDITGKDADGFYEVDILDKHSLLMNQQNPFQIIPNKLDGPHGTAPMGSHLALKFNFTQNLPQGVYQLDLKFKQTNNKNIDILFNSGKNLINSYSQERYYNGVLTPQLAVNERQNLTSGRFIYNLDTEWLTKIKIEIINNGKHGMTLDHSAKNFPTPTPTPTYPHHISNAGASFKPITTNEQTITDFLEIILVPANSSEVSYTPYEIEFDTSDQFVRPFIRLSRVASE